MKVAFFSAHLRDGGAERALSVLSQYWPIDVEQILILFDGKTSYVHKGRVILIDVPNTSRSLCFRAIRFLRRWISLRRVLAAERPDAVISFLGEPNILNVLCSKRAIVTIHNSGSMHSGISGAILRKCMQLCFHNVPIIAVSQGIKKNLVEWAGIQESNVHVIPNPVDIEKIFVLASAGKTQKSGRVPRIVTMGRFAPEKGQWHLVRAFAKLRQERPCELYLLGGGILEPVLRQMAADLGVAKDVHFLGWVEDPYTIVADADIFALTSISEGFGNVLLEAMACGVPVVASDCDFGPREILGSAKERVGGAEYAEYGILVPCFDGVVLPPGVPLSHEESVLKDVLGSLLTDPALCAEYSAAGRRRVRQYAPQVSVARYLELVEQFT